MSNSLVGREYSIPVPMRITGLIFDGREAINEVVALAGAPVSGEVGELSLVSWLDMSQAKWVSREAPP